MKKLLIVSLFLVFGFCGSALALITTDNTDRDSFQYELGYRFATGDIGASKTSVEVYTNPVTGSNIGNDGITYYVIPRGSSATYQGRIVGISAYAGKVCTLGGATFDVTINSNVTGIQAVIDSSTARSAVGITGSTGTQYSYIRHDRTQSNVEQGFRPSTNSWTPDRYNADHPYGKATGLVAGDRIGVKMTTSSNFTPNDADVVITVYVLQ